MDNSLESPLLLRSELPQTITVWNIWNHNSSLTSIKKSNVVASYRLTSQWYHENSEGYSYWTNNSASFQVVPVLVVLIKYCLIEWVNYWGGQLDQTNNDAQKGPAHLQVSPQLDLFVYSNILSCFPVTVCHSLNSCSPMTGLLLESLLQIYLANL